MASKSSNSALIVGLAFVGIIAFFLMRKKGGLSIPGLGGGDDEGLPFAAGFDPIGGATGPRPLEPESNLVQGTLQFPLSDKVSIPIISGSVDYLDPTDFDEFAHGMCQCDAELCCYKAPYQPRRGDIELEETCNPVLYGDQVQACDTSFAEWQDGLSDSGIDNSDYIRNKVRDRHSFFRMDDGYGGKNRYDDGSSDVFDYAAYLAYANIGGRSARTPGYKLASAMLANTNAARKRRALRSIIRDRSKAKRTRAVMRARKLS